MTKCKSPVETCLPPAGRRQHNNITSLVTRSARGIEDHIVSPVTRPIKERVCRKRFLSLKKYEIIFEICLTNEKILI